MRCRCLSSGASVLSSCACPPSGRLTPPDASHLIPDREPRYPRWRPGGPRVARIRPRERVVALDELDAAITPRTRVFCTTWVHSFSGYAINLDQLGAICRSRGVTFVVNASQALGARPIDLARSQVDALTCVGFKWLCGPYGTGFCWLRPELRSTETPKGVLARDADGRGSR
jgi:cysteine sulfinate desulfinase/cysteine desulfurase-like protein